MALSVSRGQVQSRTLPTSRQAALGKERTVTTERCWSREIRHPAVGYFARGHSKVLVQRVSEFPPPTKKTKQNITKRQQKQRDQQQLALTKLLAHTKKGTKGFFLTTVQGR